MRYFKIKETEIPITPFKKVKVNAVQWIVTNLSRGAEIAELVCSCLYIDGNDLITSDPYSYVLYIPKETLDIWMEDSVIDDFIITESNGLFEKE